MPPIRYIITIAIILTIAAAGTIGLTVYFWFPGWLPLVAFFGFGFAPLAFRAFLGAFFIDPTRTKDALVDEDSPNVLIRLRASVAPVLILGGLWMGILGTWQFEDVRAEVAERLVDMRFEWIGTAAVMDSSDKVLVRVCEALGRNNMNLVLGQWTPMLPTASNDLTTCLVENLPTSDAPDMLVGISASRWASSLMSEGIQPQAACQKADWLRRSISIGYPNGSLDLFSCVIDAPEPESRSCCADAIRAESQGTGIGAIVGSPNQMVRTVWTQKLGRFMEMASQEELPPPVRVALGSQPEDFLEWSVWAACLTFEDVAPLERYQLSSSVSRVVSSKECRLPIMTDDSINIWNRGCALTYEAGAPQEMRALCPNIRDGIVAATMTESHRTMAKAIRRASSPGRERRLIEQLLQYPKGQKAQPPPKQPIHNSLINHGINQGATADQMLKLLKAEGLVPPGISK